MTEQKPDIAIVDINMPGINGLEALEILKMKDIPVKMVINTAYSDFELVQQAIVLGASRLYFKADRPGKILPYHEKSLRDD